jgi:hypothetical protein
VMRRVMLLLALLVLPSPSWAQIAPVLESLRAVRSIYPTPMSPAHVSEMLSRTLINFPTFRLLRKTGGAVCPTPTVGVTISCDWIVDTSASYAWDVIRDVETLAQIQVGNEGPLAPGAELVAPWPVGTGPQQPQEPQTPIGGAVTPDVVRAIVSSEVDRVYAQSERIFANVSDNLLAILGREDLLQQQLKAHDEKTNKILAFLGDGKTITAIVSAISTYLAIRTTKQ